MYSSTRHIRASHAAYAGVPGGALDDMGIPEDDAWRAAHRHGPQSSEHLPRLTLGTWYINILVALECSDVDLYMYTVYTIQCTCTYNVQNLDMNFA